MGPLDTTLPPDIAAWCAAFTCAVRERDFDAGRALFAADAHGFGTVAARWDSRAALEAEQWRVIWPVTEGFTFEDAALVCETPTVVTVAVAWSSIGRASGDHFERRGRATLVLRRAATVQCVHSHFSLAP